MLKKYQKFIDSLSILLSGVLIFVVFILIFWLGGFSSGRDYRVYLQTGAAFSFFVFLVMWLRNFSASDRFASAWSTIGKLGDCYFWGILGYALFLMFFKPGFGSRLYFLTSFLLSFFILCLFHLLARIFYEELRRRDLNFRTVLIIGNKSSVAPSIREIETHKFFGLRISGLVGLEEGDIGEVSGCSYIGKVEEIGRILDRQAVDYVLFVIDRKYPAAVVASAILLCRQRNVEVWVRPDFMSVGLKFSKISYLGEIPFFNFSDEFMHRILIKQGLDVVIAAVLLLVLFVPMLVIGILIRLTSPGAVIFQQKRVGMNGRLFTMYKFRTMCEGAEQKNFTALLVNDMKGPVFKMKDDPRMTPIGRVLRKHSLDELPQLWNVLLGDMSLVGPRPPLLSEVVLYESWQRFRFSMRPGITCLWQVAARNQIVDFNEWAALDLQYIDQWSLWLDIKIFFKTIVVVFKGTGM